MSKILSFQHGTSINISIEISYLFFIPSLQIYFCVFPYKGATLWLVPFQVLSSHLWLVATILESAAQLWNLLTERETQYQPLDKRKFLFYEEQKLPAQRFNPPLRQTQISISGGKCSAASTSCLPSPNQPFSLSLAPRRSGFRTLGPSSGATSYGRKTRVWTSPQRPRCRRGRRRDRRRSSPTPRSAPPARPPPSQT